MNTRSRRENNVEIERHAWAAHAAPLADWALLQVNRTDVWGGYYRTDKGKTVNKTTRPAVKDRGKVQLGLGDLRRHFRGERTEELAGLHTTSPDNTSLWAAIEFDRHSDADPPAEVIQVAALVLHDRLVRQGLRPLLTTSDGKGGLHLRTLFSRPVPTPLLFAWLQALTEDYSALGLYKQPETFPKQPQVTPEAPCGSWLRLPGKHHTNGHWSTVWDGTGWLAGAAAVEKLLSYRGDDPALIPELCGENPATVAGQSTAWTAEDWAWLDSVWNLPPKKDEAVRRAIGYLRRCNPAISGQWGHNRSFGIVRAIVWGFDLGADLGFQMLKQHYNPVCRPPWSDKELMHKCRDADTKPYRKPRGHLLLETHPLNRIPRPGRPQVIRGRKPGHVILRCSVEVRPNE
jgi:hypothetical protein